MQVSFRTGGEKHYRIRKELIYDHLYNNYHQQSIKCNVPLNAPPEFIQGVVSNVNDQAVKNKNDRSI